MRIEKITALLRSQNNAERVKQELLKFYANTDKENFYMNLKKEYLGKYPEYRNMTASEYLTLHGEEAILYEELISIPQVKIAYDNKPTFEEYRDETESVFVDTEPVLEEDGSYEEKSIYEDRLIRPYAPKEDFTLEIETFLLTLKENPTLEEAKKCKYKQLGEWHKSIFRNGYVKTSLGITVDARRVDEKNDLQNVQSLINRYNRGHSVPHFRDYYNESHELDPAKLQVIADEIEDYHAEMFIKKHNWAVQITEAQTVEEVVNIQIG